MGVDWSTFTVIGVPFDVSRFVETFVERVVVCAHVIPEGGNFCPTCATPRGAQVRETNRVRLKSEFAGTKMAENLPASWSLKETPSMFPDEEPIVGDLRVLSVSGCSDDRIPVLGEVLSKFPDRGHKEYGATERAIVDVFKAQENIVRQLEQLGYARADVKLYTVLYVSC